MNKTLEKMLEIQNLERTLDSSSITELPIEHLTALGNDEDDQIRDFTHKFLEDRLRTHEIKIRDFEQLESQSEFLKTFGEYIDELNLFVSREIDLDDLIESSQTFQLKTLIIDCKPLSTQTVSLVNMFRYQIRCGLVKLAVRIKNLVSNYTYNTLNLQEVHLSEFTNTLKKNFQQPWPCLNRLGVTIYLDFGIQYTATQLKNSSIYIRT